MTVIKPQKKLPMMKVADAVREECFHQNLICLECAWFLLCLSHMMVASIILKFSSQVQAKVQLDLAQSKTEENLRMKLTLIYLSRLKI